MLKGFIIPGKNKWHLKKPSKNIPITFSSKVNETSHKSKVPKKSVNVFFSLANTDYNLGQNLLRHFKKKKTYFCHSP